MKMFKKIISLVLAVGMIAGLGTSCKQGNGSDETTLKWIMIGPGELKDSQEVWAEFNNKLQEYMPGTTVEFEVIPGAEYAEKFRLLASSGEVMDLAWTGYAQDYLAEVNNGAFYPLNEFLETETGAKLKAEIPDWAFNLQRVNGECYSVPCMQMLVNIPNGFIFPKDLYDEFLGDEKAAKIVETFTSDKPIGPEDYAIIEEYLEACKQAGKLGKGISPGAVTYSVAERMGRSQYMISGIGPCGNFIRNNEDTLKVYDREEHNKMMDVAYDKIAEWFQKGYIRNDILGLSDTSADIGVKGGYVLWHGEAIEGREESYSKKYNMDVKIVPFENKGFIDYRRVNTATAVCANSRNPEKAFELLTLMNTAEGKDLLNLLSFGIEGKHYKKTGENRIEILGPDDVGSSKNDYGYNDWSLGNTFNTYETQYQSEGFKEYCKQLNDEAVKSPLIGFSVDISDMQVEWTQCQSIFKEYSYLKTAAGAVDYKKELANRKSRMDAAGADKVAEEIRRQIEEFKKINK